jgi:HEAT repeat protein
MKGLAEAYKKTDPSKYAAEMEALKDELASLMQAAKTLFKESDIAIQELFRMIREEADPVVKDRMAFLLRFVDPAKVTPYAIGLSESPAAADRKAAVGVLQDLRTQESANAMMRRAEADADLEIRQRAIVGLGKMLSGMSADHGRYEAAVFESLRRYVQPANEAVIRAAAYDAFSYPPRLSPEDRKLITDGLRAETDPVVRKSAESAVRHMNVRDKAEADRANPKNKVLPR